MRLSAAKSGFSPLLIAPFFLWGTAMVAMKGTIDHTTPFFLAGVRLLPAGCLVLAWAWLYGRKQPQTWTAWAWITLFALVDGALFQGFLAQGLVRTDAGLGSVMIDSQPLAVALLAAWLFSERIGLIGWLGLLVGVLGISLLGLPESLWVDLSAGAFSLVDWSLDIEQAIVALFDNGQWLMLLAALSMAFGTVLSRYVSRHVDSVVATGWHMILGGIPMFWLSSQLEVEQWTHLQSGDWAALAYSTIFGSAIAYGLFFYFAASGSLTSLSALTFLTPVFALLFGNLFLAETLTPVQSIGVVLTLVSIYLINQRDNWSRATMEDAGDGKQLLAEGGNTEDHAQNPQNRTLIANSRLKLDPKSK
ncbi:EamA family transporter [filamentous cyanobacterium LEGE 11480]|uniref:EamA family transporter n=1 Tax=Romeriopsis navalis LEGE 11480 TaxID=2777977 RepID=A0A928VTS5_9CYAN|nr:EamA family transporter [Romeriopsis navalis]MBE9032440.1 EamA family transporter [Romeriopsis navalis LEGE 11480]